MGNGSDDNTVIYEEIEFDFGSFPPISEYSLQPPCPIAASVIFLNNFNTISIGECPSAGHTASCAG